MSNIIKKTYAYYSQFGQDKYINEEIFKYKKNGYFIDIGAYDGKNISNTYYFEKELGWHGICVEPIPEIYEQLISNRDCTCIHGCVDTHRGKGKFLHVIGGDSYGLVGYSEEGYPKLKGKEHSEMLSGLVDQYHPKHLELIERELRELGGSKQFLDVECYLFEDILQKANTTNIDYLSIDTEGSELNILRTIDFERVNINVISVEVLYPEIPIESFLNSKGFTLVATKGFDQIYQKILSVQNCHELFS